MKRTLTTSSGRTQSSILCVLWELAMRRESFDSASLQHRLEHAQRFGIEPAAHAPPIKEAFAGVAGHAQRAERSAVALAAHEADHHELVVSLTLEFDPVSVRRGPCR